MHDLNQAPVCGGALSPLGDGEGGRLLERVRVGVRSAARAWGGWLLDDPYSNMGFPNNT